MRVFKWLFITAVCPYILYSCELKDYNHADLYSDTHQIQAVIEIPAGTSHFIEYCGITHRFNVLNNNEEGSSGRSMPYPFNIGFIPSTSLTENSEKAGQTIDVLIVSETLQTGNIIEILPVGMINLKKDFGTRQWIIAVPYNRQLRVISAENMDELNTRYAGVVKLIEEWLCYSETGKCVEILNWQNEVLAVKFIQAVALN